MLLINFTGRCQIFIELKSLADTTIFLGLFRPSQIQRSHKSEGQANAIKKSIIQNQKQKIRKEIETENGRILSVFHYLKLQFLRLSLPYFITSLKKIFTILIFFSLEILLEILPVVSF